MQVNVIVVGGGGAGLSAAVAAAERGHSVLVLEKHTKVGGTTAWSIGSIAASCTAEQQSLGITDSWQEHWEDMGLISRNATDREDNAALRRVLARNVSETMSWLRSMGVQFCEPVLEPPHRKPRVHNVLPGASAYIFQLRRRAERMGVRIITRARARRFVMREGRVNGVEYEDRGGEVRVVYAARGVVLATGDYAGEGQLKAKLILGPAAQMPAVNPICTGDGHRMAQELGAQIVNGDIFLAGVRFVPPAKPSWLSNLPPHRLLARMLKIALRVRRLTWPRRFLMANLTTVAVPSTYLFSEGAILINRMGERFADENQKLIPELSSQPDGSAFVLMDGALADRFSVSGKPVSTAPGLGYAYLADYEQGRPDLVHKASTLANLAARIGIDGVQLERTVEAYNTMDGPGPGGLPPRASRPQLRHAPFYALGPLRNYVNFTDGGLAVNERLQVLDAQQQSIPGLHAAGAVGQGGLLLKGHGHHLSWTFTSGRLAGLEAAGVLHSGDGAISTMVANQ